ncbi:MAG TPA: GGDEF domain-containing protein, partial [Methylomirabilota bacterium]|nr:GGDEF domain-containing protein [Methylomirabilota bacterium]
MARRARAAQTPAARRIKRKILIAIALTAFLPMLVVAYLVYAYALPLLDPQAQERNLPWMLVMLGGTGLLMAAGSFMLWDLATSVVRHADSLDAPRRPAPAAGASRPAASPETTAVQQYVQQSDEVDSLMQSFSRMLVTIEQQASDVNEDARRLDTAYKELESTSAQLKEFSFKDEVTGLYNRRFFSIRLEEEVSR